MLIILMGYSIKSIFTSSASLHAKQKKPQIVSSHLFDDCISRSTIRGVQYFRIVKQEVQHETHGSGFTSLGTATVIIHVVYHFLFGLSIRIWAADDWAEILPHLS